MKLLSRIFVVFFVAVLLNFASIASIAAQTCVVKWWGDLTGWNATSETGRTAQARHEAFGAIFDHAPQCSGPCGVEYCVLIHDVPEGCDGWGYFDAGPGYAVCDTEMLCDSGEWQEYLGPYGGPWTYYGSWDVFCGADTDGDGLPDNADNCMHTQNPDQEDSDDDWVGDVCDNCPNIPNSNQEDTDSTGIGNACNDLIDADSDEWEDSLDNCPNTSNTLQEDSDDDYYGDACDNCPTASNQPQNDSYPPQGNGIGDACECEGNFNCAEDQDVDGSDASTFKIDFGRGMYNNPCTTENPCPGNFNCDRDCDGTDASLFKQDFGRSAIINPCPLCMSREAWCPACLPDGAECIYNADCCNGCCCTLHFSPGVCEFEDYCLYLGGGCRAY